MLGIWQVFGHRSGTAGGTKKRRRKKKKRQKIEEIGND